MKISISATILLTLAAGAATRAVDAFARTPNVVFILADDLGWRDLGCCGSHYHESPNIDRLAGRTLRFTQAYSASPLCSPTRSSIMTGLFPARIGITVPGCHVPEVILESTVAERAAPNQKWLQVISATRLKREYFTVAESFKQAGYATAHFGKWHLGAEPYSPLEQGFDVDLPHTPAPAPVGGYLAPWKFWPGQGTPGEHIEDRMAAEAVKFIRANRDRPFYVNYWAFSVHAPFDAKQALIEQYEAKTPPADEKQRCPTYAAMIRSFDDAVGALVKTLDEEKLWDNTILVLTSDNGGNMYDRVRGLTPTSNDPLRSGKGGFYEGGSRVPCMIHWPGLTKPGTTTETPIMSTDHFPTFCDLLKIPAPPVPFDGKSFGPLLRGKPFERGPLFSHFPHPIPNVDRWPASWVRDGDWKLIRLYNANDDQTDRFELYHLRNDPGETRDLAASEPERVKALNAKLTDFLTKTGAVLPKANPRYDPEAAVEVLGWRAGNDARLRAAPTGLAFQSTGNDPQMMVALQPAIKGPVRFEFRMKSNSRGAGAVYWSVGKQPYHRDRGVFFEPKHDLQWHDYQFELKTPNPISSLRLDPSSAPGEIEIERIRLLDPSGTELKAWTFAPKK